MKIYNAFGIKPTNTFTSAGSDYYIPNINDKIKEKLALQAFEKSYNKTSEEIIELYKIIENKYEHKDQIVNLLHLYLALYNPVIESIKEIDNKVEYFIKEHVLYDNKRNVVGIKIDLNDTLFINSGIKIALDTVLEDQTIYPFQNDVINQLRMLGIGVAGLYVNKSGMGNKGYDVRACLVDEDYSGYVHLSLAYTKDLVNKGQNYIYCGDKLVQMMLIPVFHTQYEEISEEEYNNIMCGSKRGDSGFGSSDIKH